MMTRIVVCASVMLVAMSSCAASAVPAATQAKVLRVIDGDTIVVRRDGVTEKCRLPGIDTPELSYGSLLSALDRLAAHTPADERAELNAAIAVIRRHAKSQVLRARSARATLTKILGERTVILVPDSTQPGRDRYGRLLIYIELDGLDVGAELVRRGLAIVDERFPCDRIDEYLRLQIKARDHSSNGTD